MSPLRLHLPLDLRALQSVKAGTWIHLSGMLYTARDAALKRIKALVQDGKQPPVDLGQQMIYFVGPTPAAPGEAIGSAGPTTSRRMEPFLSTVLDAGVVAVMGKGPLSPAMVAEFHRRGAVYLSAAGGAGAFYGSKIKGAAVTAFEELGPEAIYSLHVENFPAVLAIDLLGGDLFAQAPASYRKD